MCVRTYTHNYITLHFIAYIRTSYHIYMHAAYMHAYAHIRAHIHIHVQIHVHTHTYTYIHMHTDVSHTYTQAHMTHSKTLC